MIKHKHLSTPRKRNQTRFPKYRQTFQTVPLSQKTRLFPVRSPLLRESRLISFPRGSLGNFVFDGKYDSERLIYVDSKYDSERLLYVGSKYYSERLLYVDSKYNSERLLYVDGKYDSERMLYEPF